MSIDDLQKAEVRLRLCPGVRRVLCPHCHEVHPMATWEIREYGVICPRCKPRKRDT